MNASADAIVLARDHLASVHGKTTHGLVRGPSRFSIAGVLDPSCAGRDAGEVVDGTARGIPVGASVEELLAGPAAGASVCVLGVANAGGVLPPEQRGDVLAAARAGLTLVSGLHHLLADDAEIAGAVAASGGEIIDIRRPRPVRELHFWSGEILELRTPRVAVLGTDCALGKRTTCMLVQQACRDRGLRAEVVYTGQTGWLQGIDHGFILDATANDFVCGELEHAVLQCARDLDPEVILIEGQSALRNPSGPCGAELLVSARAAGVILQHAPGRRHFIEWHEQDLVIPPLREEVDLITILGSRVWAITLSEEGLTPEAAESERERIAAECGVPVVFPFREGVDAVVDRICLELGRESGREPGGEAKP